MSKKVKEVTEEEIARIVETYKDEAIKNAINAFNEGFLLGVRHARTVFPELKEAKDE